MTVNIVVSGYYNYLSMILMIRHLFEISFEMKGDLVVEF